MFTGDVTRFTNMCMGRCRGSGTSVRDSHYYKGNGGIYQTGKTHYFNVDANMFRPTKINPSMPNRI